MWSCEVQTRRMVCGVLLVVSVTGGSVARAKSGRDWRQTFTTGPVCWRYVNSASEEFLLRLRGLRLGPTSYIVSGVLAGEEGQYPIFGNAELINGRIRSNLVLNDAYPSIPSTFLSAVQFAVDLDPQSLDGQFEWLSPTLSGPADGPRDFQAYSLHGTLSFLHSGVKCARASEAIEN
jgi:hypothetical protein